jgi:hypothetical protein
VPTLEVPIDRIARWSAAIATLALGGLLWTTRGEHTVSGCLDDGGAVLVFNGRQVCNLSFHNMFDVTPVRPTWVTVAIVVSGAVTLASLVVLLLLNPSSSTSSASP